jgi:hypothetical protein
VLTRFTIRWFSKEDFSIPPTPGPRSLASPIPNTGRLQRNRFPFGFTGAEVKSVSEIDSQDGSVEEVVDSMRRYANGSKATERKDAAEQLQRIRSPLIEQLDDHTLSSSISDDGDIMDGTQGAYLPDDRQSPSAIPIVPTTQDLQPIISLISSLHASTQSQSSEVVASILAKHDKKLAVDRAEREENRQTVVQQVQDAQAEVARVWEDMRQQDDMREQNLKRLLETASSLIMARAVTLCLMMASVNRPSNVYSNSKAPFPTVSPKKRQTRP